MQKTRIAWLLHTVQLTSASLPQTSWLSLLHSRCRPKCRRSKYRRPLQCVTIANAATMTPAPLHDSPQLPKMTQIYKYSRHTQVACAMYIFDGLFSFAFVSTKFSLPRRWRESVTVLLRFIVSRLCSDNLIKCIPYVQFISSTSFFVRCARDPKLSQITSSSP